MKITEFDLKWVHMARYELILRLDGALWLTITSKPRSPNGLWKNQKVKKNPESQICLFIKLILLWVVVRPCL